MHRPQGSRLGPGRSDCPAPFGKAYSLGPKFEAPDHWSDSIYVTETHLNTTIIRLYPVASYLGPKAGALIEPAGSRNWPPSWGCSRETTQNV